jgi:hypothetical protein
MVSGFSRTNSVRDVRLPPDWSGALMKLKRSRVVELAIVLAAFTASVVSFDAAVPVSLSVKGRASANVSMAASGRFVAVVWAASTEAGVTDIYVAASRDAGGTFSTPVRVNSTAGAARVNGEQPPHVSLVPRANAEAGLGPDVVIVWTAQGGVGTVLLTARSVDGAKTFSPSAIVPGTNAAGNRGWEAIATDKSGRVDAIWLDHRETAQAGTMDMSHHMDHATSASMQMDSVAKAQLSKLYFGAISSTGGSAANPPLVLTGGVCYCCKTALAVGGDGAMYAAWRHVYPGNMRDIAFTMSRDAGKTFTAPVRVSEDKWALDGCPENGPAIAVDARNTVQLAWPTLISGSNPAGALGLFYTTSRDGRQFSARQTIPTTGTPRHVQIAATRDGSPVLVWDESGAAGRSVVLARGMTDRNGRVAFVRHPLTMLGDASYPALALTTDGVLVAATAGGAADSVIRFSQVRLE